MGWREVENVWFTDAFDWEAEIRKAIANNRTQLGPGWHGAAKRALARGNWRSAMGHLTQGLGDPDDVDAALPVDVQKVVFRDPKTGKMPRWFNESVEFAPLAPMLVGLLDHAYPASLASRSEIFAEKLTGRPS